MNTWTQVPLLRALARLPQERAPASVCCRSIIGKSAAAEEVGGQECRIKLKAELWVSVVCRALVWGGCVNTQLSQIPARVHGQAVKQHAKAHAAVARTRTRTQVTFFLFSFFFFFFFFFFLLLFSLFRLFLSQWCIGERGGS